MSDYVIDGELLTDIADAIREKTGESGVIIPEDMPDAISDISGGGGSTLITKNINANCTYNASADSADGYSSVTVNVQSGGGGTVLTGDSEPSASLGNDGDIYLMYGLGNGVPSDHRIFSSLTGTGNQYIVTDLKNANVGKVEVSAKFTVLPENNDGVFGSAAREDDGSLNFCLSYWSGRMYFVYGTRVQDANVIYALDQLQLDTDYVFVCDVGGDAAYFYIDGVLQGVKPKGDVTSSYDIFLFGKNHNYFPNYARTIPMTLYYAKFYDTNYNLIRHFMPCLYNGTYGVFDIVNNVFYIATTNSGSMSAGVDFNNAAITGTRLKVNGTWKELIGEDISDVNI